MCVIVTVDVDVIESFVWQMAVVSGIEMGGRSYWRGSTVSTR